MSPFFRASTLCVVDFRHDGHPRRWFKAFARPDELSAQAAALLHDLYGERAQLVGVRPARADEELQYVRGEVPVNALCPTGRRG